MCPDGQQGMDSVDDRAFLEEKYVLESFRDVQTFATATRQYIDGFVESRPDDPDGKHLAELAGILERTVMVKVNLARGEYNAGQEHGKNEREYLDAMNRNAIPAFREAAKAPTARYNEWIARRAGMT